MDFINTNKFQKSVKIIRGYNMQGAQIKSFNINQRGATSVTIEGFTLDAGMYFYTLIADSKEVDTKKMILTRK